MYIYIYIYIIIYCMILYYTDAKKVGVAKVKTITKVKTGATKAATKRAKADID